MKAKIIISALLLAPAVQANEKCSQALAGSPFYQSEVVEQASSSREVSENFTSYIKSLHQAQALSFEQLVLLQEELTAGASNYSLLNANKSNVQLSVHRPQLEVYLKSSALDRIMVVEGLTSYIEWVNKQSESRSLTTVETSWPFEEIKFGVMSFKPTKFKLKKSYPHKFSNQLSHQIELATTPITQAQWVRLMGENPSHNINGADSTTVVVNGEYVKLRPNHPVENITIWSMMEYANRLSIKEGLEPVYILNYEKFEGRAGDGTLKAIPIYTSLAGASGHDVAVNKPFRYYAKIKNLLFDIHKTQGYRLPSYSEWVYLATKMGSVRYPSDLLDQRNARVSGQMPHQQGQPLKQYTETGDVFELDEFLITEDGEKVFSFFGNTSEIATSNFFLFGEVKVISVGWNFSTSIHSIKSERRSGSGIHLGLAGKSKLDGFRLVRTLSK